MKAALHRWSAASLTSGAEISSTLELPGMLLVWGHLVFLRLSARLLGDFLRRRGILAGVIVPGLLDYLGREGSGLPRSGSGPRVSTVLLDGRLEEGTETTVVPAGGGMRVPVGLAA